MTQPRFPPGQIVATPAALDALPSAEIQTALHRHLSGDWGDCSPADRDANDRALECGDRLFSVYLTHDEARNTFWIITEADRSATTILLPTDY